MCWTDWLKKLLLFALCVFQAESIVLEDLIENGKLNNHFKNKKVGYYLGSFDPIHIGHENLVKMIIEKGLCDFVIVYPLWNGYLQKNLEDVETRTEMLFSVFKDCKNVIVTRLPPYELQRALAITDGKFVVKPAAKGNVFVGILGSDAAIKLKMKELGSGTFVAGKKIKTKHRTHAIGCCMALPVEEFIVCLRRRDKPQILGNKLFGRKITNILNQNHRKFGEISSTLVRKLIVRGNLSEAPVSPAVLEIIKKRGLYVNKS